MVNVEPDNEALTKPSTLEDAAGVLACTNAVVAICVVLVVVAAVGAVGVPVRAGFALGARASFAVSTKAVVATCVVFVPALAVTALKASEASPLMSALVFTAVLTAENSVLKSAPDITFAALESAKLSLPAHLSCVTWCWAKVFIPL